MKLKIRKINWSDSGDILNWRNDTYSRRNSFSKKIISQEAHNEWYGNIIDKNKHISFIAKVNKVNVGFVTYKYKSKNKLYASINLNPKYRGKNIGSRFLILSSQKIILNGFDGIFYAKIKQNNLASIKSFLKASYVKYRRYKDYILFTYNVQNKGIDKMKKKESFNEIIDQIENIRSKNNTNWMDLLRIAFKYSPKEAARVMSNIYKQDQKISLLAKKLNKNS